MLKFVKLNILIPLQFNMEDFSKIQVDRSSILKSETEENNSSVEWYCNCFYDKPIEKNYQMANSPLLEEGNYQMKRIEFDAKLRAKIGIQKNENAIHTLVKDKINFRIGKIRILFTKCGIAFAHFELNAEHLTDKQTLIFANAFKNVVSKQPLITYMKKISKEKANKVEISFKEIVLNLLGLQSYLPLVLYDDPITTFIQVGLIGNFEEESKLKYFNSIQELSKRKNCKDIDEDKLYDEKEEYISRFVGDRTVCIYGDTVLCEPEPENIEFVHNTKNGLLKTATENYTTVYTFLISLCLLLRKESMNDLQEEYVINAPSYLSKEDNIREFFNKCLWKNGWNLNRRIAVIKDNIRMRQDAERKKENKQIIEHIEKVEEGVEQLHEDHKQQNEYLESIKIFLETDLKVYLEKKKKEFQQTVNETEVPEDMRISRFIQTTSDYIDEKIECSGVDSIGQERENLRNLFGDNWNYLLPTSQTSLVSSGTLLRQCSGIDSVDFDFSGICICATSALEAELKRIFFDGLLDYMVVNYGEPKAENKSYKNWPDALLCASKYDLSKKANLKPKKIKNFTMGTLPYLFGQRTRSFSNGRIQEEKEIAESELMRVRMSEYLSTIVQEDYKEDPFGAFYSVKITDSGELKQQEGCFVWKCEKIRNDYRNKAAHVNVMSKEEAVCCYQSIIRKPDFYGYNAEITGVILDLFNMIDGGKLHK